MKDELSPDMAQDAGAMQTDACLFSPEFCGPHNPEWIAAKETAEASSDLRWILANAEVLHFPRAKAEAAGIKKNSSPSKERRWPTQR